VRTARPTRLSKNPEFQPTGIRKLFIFKNIILWKIQKLDFFDSLNEGMQATAYSVRCAPASRRA
jgi:hypothetical protein